jgi:hypothetical protein
VEFNGTTAAILLGVWGTFAMDAYSAFCSSPQTTEINARTRAPTLMKWVNIGGGIALAGGVVATVVSKEPWPLLAVGGMVILFHLLYRHAARSGLASPLPGTEQVGEDDGYWRPA